MEDMGHVVILAIASVADVDILRAGCDGMPVNNGAKGTKLILTVNWLQQSIRIQMRVQILKRVDMNAICALDGVAWRNEIFVGRRIPVTAKKDVVEPSAAIRRYPGCLSASAW